MVKETIYYTLNFKSNIFIKDKGRIRVYEIISENKKINGIEVYQLESNKKYFLVSTVGETDYYNTVKELLYSNRNNFPKKYDKYDFLMKPLNSLKVFKQKIIRQKSFKFSVIGLIIVSFLYAGFNLTYFEKHINFFQSEISPESPDKIFDRYKGSVVLIASQYYYEIYANDITFYYSPSSKQKIFLYQDEVLQNLSFSTGTGFIISNNGEVVTNNHVVNDKDESFKVELQYFHNSIKEKLLNQISAFDETIVNMKDDFNLNLNQMSIMERQKVEEEFGVLIEKRNNLLRIYDNIKELDINGSTSKLVIHKLGIAYNESYVTEFDDLQECVVVKTSEDEKIDLALIQTKNKSFDKKPTVIFNFIDNNPNLKNSSNNKQRNIKKPVKINDDVYMIGFNSGFELANTKQGIKSQFTGGKISQEYDGVRVLYTIPTLSGSSGSPIVDKWGNLVAVNFAKMREGQGFSFGVPVYEVKKFIDK